LAEALRSIAALLKSPKDAAMNRQHTVEALARAEDFEALSRFELEMLPRESNLPDLHGINRLAGAAFVTTSDPLVRDVDAQAVASLGDWFDRAARSAAEAGLLPSVVKAATTVKSGTAAEAAVLHLSIATEHVATPAQRAIT
jgi:hypothetical protein